MPAAVNPIAAHLSAKSTPGVGPDVLDAAVLDKLRELDPKGHNHLIERVLTAYAQSLQKLLLQLPDQVTASDAELVRQTTHTLKSSSASVGAMHMARCCAETEKACRGGDMAQWQSNVPLLRAEAQRLLDGLARAGYPVESAARGTTA